MDHVSHHHGGQKYGPLAMTFHWLVALCLLSSVILAFVMESLDAGAVHDAVLGAHKSLGIIIFMLMCARLAWRWIRPAPPLPPSMPFWQRLMARVTHALLYVVVLGMPISGYVAVAARGRDTLFLGFIEMPRWVPLGRALSRDAESLHAATQFALYALVFAHVGAALYHHFVVKDDVLRRMWPRFGVVPKNGVST